MIRQVPFQPEHLAALHVQPRQDDARMLVGSSTYGDALSQVGVAFTGLNEFGQAVVCVGAIPIWPGRATGWAALNLIPPRDWPQLHKLVLRGLDGLQRDPAYRRIEVSAPVEFIAAHRWILLLGFEIEAALARRYDPEGRDHVRYARIR